MTISLKKDILDVDGYLILKQTQRAQEQYSYLTGEKQLTNESINIFKDNIIFNNEYCMGKKIIYKHIVFPAKALLINKLLLKYKIKVNSLYSSQHNLENVFYPREIIGLSEFCLKNDTHLNDKGNLEVFLNLLNVSNLLVDKESLIVNYKKINVMGDLGRILNYGPEKTDKFIDFNDVPPHINVYSIANALKGNSGHFEYYLNTNAISEKRVLLFGDSYFRNAIHIYSSYFKEVIYVRNPFIMTDISNILEPDIIFTGNAERYLVAPSSVHKAKPFFSNFLTSSFETKNITKNDEVVLQLLLLGRHNPSFKKWLGFREFTIPHAKRNAKCLHKIDINDLNTDRDVDFCRDMAVRYENNNKLALHLMTLASLKRPTGDFIQMKLKKYRECVTSKI